MPFAINNALVTGRQSGKHAGECLDGVPGSVAIMAA